MDIDQFLPIDSTYFQTILNSEAPLRLIATEGEILSSRGSSSWSNNSIAKVKINLSSSSNRMFFTK